MTGALALLIRSLRVDARLVRTHLFRFGFVGMIYLALLTTQADVFAAAPGRDFFQQIAYLNLFLITVAGVSVFATVITEEKEEGTLGLLTMAGISPVALLLGKAVPRLLTAALLLSVQLPFTFLAITLGGVTMHQVLAVYWSLLAWTVMLAGLGLLASVVYRRSRAACSFCGVLIFLLFILSAFLVATGLLAWAGGTFSRPLATVLEWCAAASPLMRLWIIMQTGFDETPFSYQVIANFVAAGALFALAWLLFNRFNREESPAAPERGPVFAGGSRLRRLGAGRAWGHPFVWKDFHFMAGGRTMTLTKFVLYGLLIAGLTWLMIALNPAAQFRGDYASLVGGVAMWTMLLALLVEGALYASRVFHDEIKWKTLPGLMMLPCSIAGIAYSKIAGCLIGLAPGAFWFTVGVLLYPAAFAEALENMLKYPQGWYTILQYLLFLHLAAFLSLSLRWGALPLAFVLIIMFNWCCFGGLALLGPRSGSEEGIFVVLSLLCTFLIFGLHLGIGTRLRAAAAE